MSARTGDMYKQNSRNWALFTHNIFHVTDQFDVTVGLRYTHERKKPRRDVRQRQYGVHARTRRRCCRSSPIRPLAAGRRRILGLSCQGNSTAELNGVSIHDKRKEHKLTGTGVLSYKPIDESAALRQLLARL